MSQQVSTKINVLVDQYLTYFRSQEQVNREKFHVYETQLEIELALHGIQLIKPTQDSQFAGCVCYIQKANDPTLPEDLLTQKAIKQTLHLGWLAHSASFIGLVSEAHPDDIYIVKDRYSTMKGWQNAKQINQRFTGPSTFVES